MTLPPLSDFLRWLRELPAPFREKPATFPGGRVRVRAVVADLFESLCGAPPRAEYLAAFDRSSLERGELNRMRWVLAACHVLWHPALRASPLPRERLESFLNAGVAEFAAVVSAERIVDSEERREELVRRILAALGLRLPGETAREAEDRLAQVDSVERLRIGRAALERERERAAEQEAREKARAAESAAKASRE